MLTVNEGLGKYIEAETGNKLSEHERFYEANVGVSPLNVLYPTRTLAETVVGYLYLRLSGAGEVPQPYWCLIFRPDDYAKFETACAAAKAKGRPAPRDYREAWEARRVIRECPGVTDTFFEEANQVRRLGNKRNHEAKALSGSDPRRTAEKCWASCVYLLGVTDEVTKEPCKGQEKAPHEPMGQAAPHRVEAAAPRSAEALLSGLLSALALERSKTASDYDSEYSCQ